MGKLSDTTSNNSKYDGHKRRSKIIAYFESRLVNMVRQSTHIQIILQIKNNCQLNSIVEQLYIQTYICFCNHNP